MEQFKHNELTFNLMVEASPNALILVNNLGNIAYLNSFAEKLFQYNKNELIGRNLETVIPSKYKKSHPSLMQSYLSNPVRRQMGENRELNAVKKDGTEFPVEIGLNPIVTVDGTLILAAIIDITERKKSANQLKQYEYFFNHTQDFSCIANVQGYFETVNSQFQNVLGYSEKELLENRFFNFIHPDDIPATSKEIEKLGKGDSTINFVNRYRKKDGDYLWFEWSASPDPNSGKLYAIARDITERKKAENQFRLVVESVPNAIILVNSDGEISMSNKQAEKQFGYTNDELVGSKLEILLPERFRNNHLSFRDMFLTNPETRSMGAGRDLFALRKDGTEFPAEIGLNPIATEDGTLILTSIIDITERKKLEESIQANTKKIEEQNQELKRSEQKLKELNATKDKFFSIIAHDLKNPFNIILGLTDLLSEDYESFSDSDKKELLSELNLSSKTTYTLLENLLTWALSQQGRIEVKKEELNLAELAQASVSPYTPNSRKKNIDIEIDVPEDQMIFVDKYTMSFMIGNIVNNAVKFTPEGGSINIASKSDSEWIELLIRDTGVGMSEKQINKLFRIEESNSTLGTNNEKGTGLGLILCKEFIKKNGGDIRVESEIGKGSIFIITN